MIDNGSPPSFTEPAGYLPLVFLLGMLVAAIIYGIIEWYLGRRA